MKHELKAKKKRESYLNPAKNVVLLAKENKCEDKAIKKEAKLAKAIHDLNYNSRLFEMLRKTKRKVKVEVKSCKHKFNNAK